MNLSERYIRWRHSKGYGIHSPLAFHLAETVLRPDRKVAYYAYDRLEAIASDTHCTRLMERRAKMILRFTVMVNPSYVWVSPRLPEIYMEAIRAAGSVIRIYDGATYPLELDRAELIVTDRFKPTVDQLKKILVAPKGMIAFDVSTAIMNRVEKYLKDGVMLEGVDSLITLCRDGVSAVKYEVGRF